MDKKHNFENIINELDNILNSNGYSLPVITPISNNDIKGHNAMLFLFAYNSIDDAGNIEDCINRFYKTFK